MNKLIPTTTTAAVLVETGKPVVIIEDIVIPALTRGQVLVRVMFAGLCNSQLKEVRGHRGKDPWVPHLLGHEGTGEVISIGDGVSKVKAGDKVVLGWIKGEGLDSGGTKYRGPNGCIINAGGVATFCDYSVISENRLVLLPPHTPIDLAVLYGCALPTGMGIVFNQIRPRIGATIAVIGLGGIGLSALIAATTFEPKMLVSVDIETDKLNLARELGATHTINSADVDPVKAVRELTGGVGVDHVIEAGGITMTIEQGYEMIRENGGELVFATHPRAGERICLDPFGLICGKFIRGSWGGGSKPDRDIPRLDALYADGKLPLEKLLSHTYSLSELNHALDDLDSRKIVRGLIDICGSVSSPEDRS